MDNKHLLKSTMIMYKGCAVEATVSLFKNWRFLIASVAAYVLFLVAFMIFGPFGMMGGFILGLVNIALLTYYYTWLSECVRKNTISWREYLAFDYSLFSCIINPAFILYLAVFMLDQLTNGLDAVWFIMCTNLGIFLVFNALPEMLYIHHCQGVSALPESYNFIRENWIEWFAPLLVFFAPILVQSPVVLLFMLSSGDPLLPVLKLVQAFSDPTLFLQALIHGFLSFFDFFLLFITLVAASWFMIFRGFLFRELESGSRRQRAFILSQR